MENLLVTFLSLEETQYEAAQFVRPFADKRAERAAAVEPYARDFRSGRRQREVLDRIYRIDRIFSLNLVNPVAV